jgi:hypothetical protein
VWVLGDQGPPLQLVAYQNFSNFGSRTHVFRFSPRGTGSESFFAMIQLVARWDSEPISQAKMAIPAARQLMRTV